MKKMKSKYVILINLNTEMKKFYENYYKAEGYEILSNEDTILFVKQPNAEEINKEHETNVVKLVLNMAKSYFHEGVLYIDLTDVINEILQKSEEKEKINLTDNCITLPIRKAIEKSIINKNADMMPKIK